MELKVLLETVISVYLYVKQYVRPDIVEKSLKEVHRRIIQLVKLEIKPIERIEKPFSKK